MSALNNEIEMSEPIPVVPLTLPKIKKSRALKKKKLKIVWVGKDVF